MKRFLRNKWHRIPVGIVSAVLALALITGGVLAVGYTVWGGTGAVTVGEAFTVTNRVGDDGQAFTGTPGNYVWNVTMFAGETKTLNLWVHNASSVPLSVGVIHEISGPSNDMTFEYGGGGEILGGADQQVALEVYMGGNATPGDYTITFGITRE